VTSLTFLICTRNGSSTLAECIAHIGRQKGIPHDEFEVLIVDNGSSDGTVGIAQAALAELKCATKFVVEPKEGKIRAFLRGLQLSEAPYVSVIDDDNFIGEEFACRSMRMYSEFPELGIVGSVNTIDAQHVPAWFPLAAGRFACAKPHLSGEIKPIDRHREIASHGMIAGAGSTFRKEPLLRALELGFGFVNDTLRGGGAVSGGEDLELCFLLQYCGYWFGFDRRITLQHRINPNRLTWAYARRLSRGIGECGLVLDAFIWIQSANVSPGKGTWWWLAARRVRRLATRLPTFLSHRKRFSREVLHWDTDVGALIRLCRERGAITRRMRDMKSSRWARELRNYRTNTAGSAAPSPGLPKMVLAGCVPTRGPESDPGLAASGRKADE